MFVGEIRKLLEGKKNDEYICLSEDLVDKASDYKICNCDNDD